MTTITHDHAGGTLAARGNGTAGKAECTMAKIGYARVSTRGQKDDSQVDDLNAYGVDKLFIDHGVSGKHAARPELDAAIAYMRAGDVLVITRLSRAMRSLKHLLALAEELRGRGIGLVVLKQSIDTTTPTGRLVFHILGAIDEFQRELIVEGTREGLDAARARGRTGGRKPKLSNGQAATVRRMYDAKGADGRRQHTVREIAEAVGVSRPTVYEYLRKSQAAPSGKLPPGGHIPGPFKVKRYAPHVAYRFAMPQRATAAARGSGSASTSPATSWPRWRSPSSRAAISARTRCISVVITSMVCTSLRRAASAPVSFASRSPARMITAPAWMTACTSGTRSPVAPSTTIRPCRSIAGGGSLTISHIFRRSSAISASCLARSSSAPWVLAICKSMLSIACDTLPRCA
jgi:DNA invertase Pin-like site-specific DNA recombinase